MRQIIYGLIIFLALSGVSAADTVFTVRGPEYPGDKRMDYDYAIMKLALDKTVESHGSYILNKAPSGMNFRRALRSAEMGSFPNFFVRNMANPTFEDRMLSVPFPIDLGITGYRVGFASPQTVEQLENAHSLKDLKSVTVVQGIGWKDTDILVHNGFLVYSVSSFTSMMNMVTRNRADLFLRGANEIYSEWTLNKDTQNLRVEPNLLLHYPFPRFFYTHKDNYAAVERLETGLKKAYEDGSFQKIWREKFSASLRFANLHNRRVIELKNPFISAIDKSYEKFIYKIESAGVSITDKASN